tara:strand:- start:2136 stop:2360 length:225 start_codon:yes stop_codon:yes gene_type:complete
MVGKNEVEKIFGKKLSSSFNIHRTRKGLPNQGTDQFQNMALKGQLIADRVVQEKIGGKIDRKNNMWLIPKTNNK